MWMSSVCAPNSGESDIQPAEPFAEERTFLVVNDLAAVLLGHFFRVDASVANIACDLGIGTTLVSDDLEEGAASGSRDAEDQTDLSGLRCVINTVVSGSPLATEGETRPETYLQYTIEVA